MEKKDNQQEKTTNSSLRWGVLSALAASLCCVGPLVLILLGVGGASTVLSIGYRKPYFLVFGLVVLGIAFYKLYRRSCRQEHLSRRQQLLTFGGSFLAAALLYYLLTFIVTPLAAPLIYQWRYGKVAAGLGSPERKRLQKAALSIDGMWCASCAVGAEYNLKAIEGVADAYVGFTDNLDGEGWVIYESGKVSDSQIVRAVEPYEATVVSNTVYTETPAERGTAR